MRGGKRPGAGRKSSENPMVNYVIRVPALLKKVLDELGAEKVRELLTELTKEKPP